jgi:hypothetical protein
MLQGHNPQSIRKELNIPNPTMYRDLKFLTNQSKKQVYDLARGAHMLTYIRAIEGISLTLSEAWNKFNDVTTPEPQRVSYLRLTRECNESLMQLTIEGPSVMALKRITDRANSLGIGIDNLSLNDISDNNKDSSSKGYNDTTDKYDSTHNTIN